MKPWISLIAVDPVVPGEWTHPSPDVSAELLKSTEVCTTPSSALQAPSPLIRSLVQNSRTPACSALGCASLGPRVSRSYLLRRYLLYVFDYIRFSLSAITRRNKYRRSSRIRQTVSRSATCISPCMIHNICLVPCPMPKLDQRFPVFRGIFVSTWIINFG